jgi:hypothetical protein
VSRVRHSLSHSWAEDSPSCLPWLPLTLSSNLLPLFMTWSSLLFTSWQAFAVVFAFRHAAVRSLLDASALVPMAQMKPSNSRPTAVTIFLWSFPAAAILR